MNTTPNSPDDETYQDLIFRGRPIDHPSLRAALIHALVPPWRHAEANERALSANHGNEVRVWAFERPASGDEIAPATVYLGTRGGGYAITNIVPLEASKLSYREHNAVLQDFALQIAAPAATLAGFIVETTSPYQQSSA